MTRWPAAKCAGPQRQEQRRLALDSARDAVIVRVASAYLELAKARELLLRERESAARILAFTRQRAGAGLELPIEVTRAQLTAARVEQSIARLEDREDSLAEQSRDDLGLGPDQPLEVAARIFRRRVSRTRGCSTKPCRTVML